MEKIRQLCVVMGVVLLIIAFGGLVSSEYAMIDLSATDTGNWINTSEINGKYDYIHSLFYIGGNNGKFGVYNRTSYITTDLSATDTGNWIGGDYISSLSYDSTHDLVYIGGNIGKFGVYNRTSNITTDLSATDTGNWIGNNNLNGLAYDSTHDLVYIAGGAGVFGVYNRTSNITTDLSATDTGNWMGISFLSGLAYDSTHDLVYIAGASGKFGVYNRTSNITTDLRATDTGDWIGGDYIPSLSYDNNTDLVYIGGNNGKFGVYNRTSNITTDLRATDTGDWIGNNNLNGLAYDSTHDLVYIAGASGKFGVYNRTSNITTDLSATDTGNWMGTDSMTSLSYDSTHDFVYITSATGKFGVYLYFPIVTINSIGGDSSSPYFTFDKSPVLLATTDNNADCFATNISDRSYDEMVAGGDVDCTGDGTTSHTCQFGNISYGTQTFYVACKDILGNNSLATNEEAVAIIYQPPTFVPPTPANASNSAGDSYAYINVSLSFDANLCYLEWGGANFTMIENNATNFYLNKTEYINGNYDYKVWCNSTTDYFSQSEDRSYVINSSTADILPPNILFISPANNRLYGTASANTLLEVLFAHDETVDSCGYSSTDIALSLMTPITQLNVATPFLNSRFNLTLPAEGITKCIYIRCNDTAGNEMTSGHYYCVKIDTADGGGGGGGGDVVTLDPDNFQIEPTSFYNGIVDVVHFESCSSTVRAPKYGEYTICNEAGQDSIVKGYINGNASGYIRFTVENITEQEDIQFNLPVDECKKVILSITYSDLMGDVSNSSIVFEAVSFKREIPIGDISPTCDLFNRDALDVVFSSDFILPNIAWLVIFILFVVGLLAYLIK